MIAAVITLTLLGLTLGYLLGVASKVFKVESDPVVEKIEALLPGSQCGQCGYPGCSPAAAAMASGEAAVTCCPPGGRALAESVAELLGISVDLSDMEDQAPVVAKVSEATCIGCTRCSKLCPTDAIVGGPKQIHVILRDACTGCGKCIDICPTECLQLHPIAPTLQSWQWPKPVLAA